MNLTIDQLSVLLVEPSSSQHRIIDNFLHEAGVKHVSWVKTGTEALEEMSRSEPELTISAMHLSDMTGTDLVQAMRMDDQLKSVPFMLVSSETHYRYLEPIRQAGVIAILPKPFKLEQLKSAIKSTVNYISPGELSTRNFYSDDLKVLLVDDSYTARRHIKRVLNNMGIEKITEAENGLQGLDLIKDNFFDLVVTDYNMPEMDGKEMVEIIRAHSDQASIPVLMVSSETDDSRIAAVQQVGVSAVCDKPFDSGTVKDLIEKMLN